MVPNSEGDVLLDGMGFLITNASRDRNGCPVLLVVAKQFSPQGIQLDSLQRYIEQRCDAVVSEPYSLVWIHTGATYRSNCPSVLWLWRMWERLPPKFRSNLASVYVLHCDLLLWAASAALLPWLSGQMWRKVTWISRLECLWDYVNKVDTVPRFVLEHDAVLEDQPLIGYGVTTSKEMVEAGTPNPLQ